MATTEYSIKSGPGLSDRTTSELATFWSVLPGHEEELRAAAKRFEEKIRAQEPAEVMHTGLRSARHVIFDNGTRLLFATTFETDYDPYLDDALIAVGVGAFIDWVQHTTEGEVVAGWYERYGGDAAFDESRDDYAEIARKALPELKEIIMSVQVGATAYFEALSPWTMPEVIQGAQLRAAFDKALEHPEAEQALQHPALRPLLELASA